MRVVGSPRIRLSQLRRRIREELGERVESEVNQAGREPKASVEERSFQVPLNWRKGMTKVDQK